MILILSINCPYTLQLPHETSSANLQTRRRKLTFLKDVGNWEVLLTLVWVLPLLFIRQDHEGLIIRWTWRKALNIKFKDWRAQKTTNLIIISYNLMFSLACSQNYCGLLLNIQSLSTPHLLLIAGVPTVHIFRRVPKHWVTHLLSPAYCFQKCLGHSVSQSHCWGKFLILGKILKGKFVEGFFVYLCRMR